jgi:Domain of unknown function (DUF4372)
MGLDEFFEFNLFSPFCRHSAVFQLVLEAADESWANRFLATGGFAPGYQFQLCVEHYQGNRYVKDFFCWDQFLCLVFAQLTYRESLRDIEACLRGQQGMIRAVRLGSKSEPHAHEWSYLN